MQGADPPEAVAQVLGLELKLIAARDTARHTVASALPPPARRPHVTHQRLLQGPGAGARRVEGGGESLIGRLRRLFRRG
jgi:hypothetical protein